MSIKLGTNFDLKSKQFLDSRQEVQGKSDLKNWTTPVPPGFEVCLDEVWYYYDPTINLDETGHWIPRLVSSEELESGEIVEASNRAISADAVDAINERLNGKLEEIETNYSNADQMLEEKIQEINARLNADTDEAAGYKISNIYWGTVANNTSFEVGYSVDTKIPEYNNNPAISYKITGTNYSSGPYYLDLENETLTKSSADNETKNISHDFEQPISKVHKTLTATAKLTWTYQRFWGTVTEDEKSILLNGGTEGYNLAKAKHFELSTSKSISEITFNCSGGKYPFFIVYTGNYPSWNPSKVTVGGFANSNYAISKINLVNTFDVEIPYFIFMLNQIQTANNIKITIEG